MSGRIGDQPVRRLPRAARREQILGVATEVFARTGFAATGLDDVAAAAGVTRPIVYRHFASKADLYRGALERAWRQLRAAVGEPPYTARIIDDLLAAAARDPAGFRLLFHQAGREPAFRADVDRFGADMIATARIQLAPVIDDPGWLQWAAQLAPTTTITAITAWLDAGRPDPSTAAARIRHAVHGITEAASTTPTASMSQ